MMSNPTSSIVGAHSSSASPLHTNDSSNKNATNVVNSNPANNPASIPPLSAIQHPTFHAPLSATNAQNVASTRGTAATLNLDDIFGDCFFTPEGDACFMSDRVNSGQNNATSLDGGQVGGPIVSGESVVTNVAFKPIMVSTNNSNAPIGAPQHGQIQQSQLQLQQQQQQQQQQHQQQQNQQQQQFVQVAYGGGIATTGLNQANARATIMGPLSSSMISAAPGTAMTGAGTQNAAGVNPLLTTPKLVPMTGPPQQIHHMQYGIPAVATVSSSGSGPGATLGGKKRMGGGVVNLAGHIGGVGKEKKR